MSSRQSTSPGSGRLPGGTAARATLLALALLVPVLLLAAACEAPRSTLEIVTGEWPPYTSEAAPEEGSLTEVLTAALTSMGYRPRYRFVPFYRAKEHATDRLVVGTFPWFRPPGSEDEWIVVEQPLFEVEYVVFGRRDRLRAHGVDPDSAASLADLDGLTFGGVQGYTYADEVRRRIGADHMYPSELVAFRALVAGGEEARGNDAADAAVDVVQASREVGLHLLTGPLATEDTEIVILDRGSLSIRQPVHFLVNRDYPGAQRFADELAAELASVRSSGAALRLDDPEPAPRVRLEGPPGSPGVPAFADRLDPAPTGFVPHGSPAVVVRWAPAYGGPPAPAVEGDRCRVRLLEEPGRGRLVWVPGASIRRGEDAP